MSTDFKKVMSNFEELVERTRRTNQKINPPLGDPEDFMIEPDCAPHSLDAKPKKRLNELYPNIAHYRQIPTELYTSHEVMKKEWETLWQKTWLVAGRASDIPEIGDWFKFDIGPESFIITRSSEDSVHAMYNVCRHRGNRLVNEGFGKGAKSFTCNYHSWMFTLEGKNARITDRETFAPEILCQNLDLPTVKTHIWGGFVFINMDEDPVPFEEYMGEMINIMGPYKMEDMHVIKDTQMVMPANWKTTLDAFQEMYHLHQTHPQGVYTIDDHFGQYDFFKNGHNRMIVPRGLVSKRQKDHETVNDFLKIMLRDAGIDPDTFPGKADDVREAIKQKKRKPDNAFGLDYSEMSDSQVVDNWNITWFPNITFNAYPEGMLVQRFRPHPTDPNLSIYDITVLSAKLKPGARKPFVFSATFGVDPDADISGETRPEREYTDMDNTKMGRLLDQDIEQLTGVQAGLGSKALGNKIVLSEQERRLQQFYAEYDMYMKKFK
ncbi:aromatic ring-hydroxylating dioxygenase subunit alpha [Bacillus sp. B15-48]|uniref:aromatic ring-hydroxylating oxygenase subunit alpha n=1 Tax=Bacillus sp. B15-48 TaxID=1548601 RepID=UPI00193EC50B|nr:aromatic ring-hydroxylating dioxygenase subunit alpha [Bacillus sp. B15-48]MBM4763320.1 Rieske 2Fe-2S domain-containing protein [Bacillus sp. B15-48]